MNWYVHLEMESGKSTVGPFNLEGARGTAELMVHNRNAQGYHMVDVGNMHWESETHQMDIWVRGGK